jgi:hypothetical protein
MMQPLLLLVDGDYCHIDDDWRGGVLKEKHLRVQPL